MSKDSIQKNIGSANPESLIFKSDKKLHSIHDKQPHFIFSAENPLYKENNKLGWDHGKTLDHLKNKGYNAETVQGQYGGARENAIIIHNPPIHAVPHLQQMAKDLGQESSIYSDGNWHELHFHGGENAGTFVHGQGTQIHSNKPDDNFSHMGDGTVFSHQFEWSKSYPQNHSLVPYNNIKKNEDLDLNKSPMVEPIVDVSLGSDSQGKMDEKYHYKKSIKTKNGNRVHIFDIHDIDNKPTHRIYTITHNNKPSGKPVSYLQVDKNFYNKYTEKEKANRPTITLAYTHEDHQGHGYSKDLHRIAIKNHKKLYSDTMLSAPSHGIWNSLKKDKDFVVKLKDPKNPESQHVAFYNDKPKKNLIPKEKLAASENTNNDLYKGDIWNAVKHGIVASALAGTVAMTDRFNQEPTAQQVAPEKASSASQVEDHGITKRRILNAISKVESNNGQNTGHKILGGIHGNSSAIGNYGLTPILISETIKGHPELKKRYGYIANFKHSLLHETVSNNKELQEAVANAHYDRLASHFGHDLNKISYAWLNGITGTKVALKRGEDLSQHWHVRKIRAAFENHVFDHNKVQK